MNDQIREQEHTEISGKIDLSDQREISERKPSILLHSCCGPCSTAVVEQLIHDYDVTVYFYNPNITDKEEYFKRKKAQEKFIEKYNMNPGRQALLRYKEGPYDPERFYSISKDLENEPEGCKRCGLCFKLRLEKTVDEAMLSGFDFFTTTLSVSPHKSFEVISRLGNDLSMRSGLPFLARDFKKKDGFRRSVELSKKYGLYRQNYCGCEFSR